MHRLFPIVCNMSLTASVVILAVLAVRRLLRRAPKVFSYALWAVVLFRLLCPVSVTSAVSLLGALGAPAQERSAVTSVVEYVPADKIAEEEGNPRGANMVLLGAYVAAAGSVSLEAVYTNIDHSFTGSKAKYAESNKRLVKRGYDLIAAQPQE